MQTTFIWACNVHSEILTTHLLWILPLLCTDWMFCWFVAVTLLGLPRRDVLLVSLVTVKPCSHRCCCPPTLKIHLAAPDWRPMVQHDAAHCKAKIWNSSMNIYLSFWKATLFSWGRGWKDWWPASSGRSEEGEERWRGGDVGMYASIHFLMADATWIKGSIFHPFCGGL